MIELNSLTQVHNKGLNQTDGYEVEIYANTALAEICATLSTDPIVQLGADEGSDASDASYVNGNKLVSDEKIVSYVNEVEDHTDNMQQAKDLCVRSVRQLSDIITNTINPHIRNVVSKIDECSSYRESTGLDLDIKTFKIADILLDPLVVQIVELWKDKQPTGTIFGNGIGDFDNDYLISCFPGSEGNTSSTGDTYFTDEQMLSKVKHILNGEVSLNDYQDYTAVALAAMVVNITKTPPPGISSNLTEWENRRNNMMANLVKLITITVFHYKRSLEGKALYAKAKSPTNKDIVVFEVIYKELLEQGLTPEALMGNELLNRTYRSHQLVLPEVVKICENKYNLELKAKLSSNRISNRTNLFRDIGRVLSEDLDDIAKKESWPVDGDSIEKAGARLIKVRDAIFKSKAIDNHPIEDVVAAILLATWYAHTDASTLLDIVGRICEEDPELEPKEAFTLAKIEYVGMYIASQMKLVKAK